MDKFNLREYLKNNPLLKENISMEDGEDKITYYAKELIKMHTPGDEEGVEGLLTYLADNPEEMPEDWDVDFIQDPNNYNDIMDKIFALTPMQETNTLKENDLEGEGKFDYDDPNSLISQLNDDDQAISQIVAIQKKYGKDVLQYWITSGEWYDEYA